MLISSTLIFFFGSILLGFFYNVTLALLSFAQLPFHFIAGSLVNEASANAAIERQEVYKVAGGITEESFEGIKTIASCNAQENRARKYQLEIEPLKKSTSMMGFINGIGWGVLYGVFFIYAGIQFYFSSYLIEDDPDIWGADTDTSAKEAVVILTATSMATFYLNAAMPCLEHIQSGRVAAAKLDKIIKGFKTFDGTKKIPNVSGAIEFDDVNFYYPMSPDIPILKGVTFKIESGDKLAVVGETGSGKSTIIQLIEGFYYCNSGTITIDGIDIKELDIKHLRKSISLVSQEPVLFNCTIEENIKIGYHKATDEQIINASKEAEAHDYIMNLPDQYKTWVGNKGTQLSGGQKQRIAIARAIIKNPKILLLDEATSALDINTEKKIQITLDKIIQTKTTIIVAQRLSTIKNSNKIIVLDHGVVVETGTYESLIDSNGHFSRLVHIQNQAEKELEENQIIPSETDNLKVSKSHEDETVQNPGEVVSRIAQFLKTYWQ